MTYAWSKDIQGLTSPADTVSALAGADSPNSTITFSGSARGVVIIRLKTRDGANEEGTASITFNLQAPSRSSPWRPRRGNGR